MGLNKNTLSSDVASGTPATATAINLIRQDTRLNIKDSFDDSDGATITMDLTQAPIHKVILGGNRTIAFSGAVAGQHYRVEIVQPASGGPWAVTWPSGIKWQNSTVPTLSTLANKKDAFIFYCTVGGGSPTFDGYIAGLNIG